MTFAYKCVNVSNSIGDLDFRNKLDGKISPIFKKIAIANKLEKDKEKKKGKKDTHTVKRFQVLGYPREIKTTVPYRLEGVLRPSFSNRRVRENAVGGGGLERWSA